MRRFLLERLPTQLDHTEGYLSFDREVLTTMERPWIPIDDLGGKPFESCIPSGTYALNLYKRSSGITVLSIVNPELGVYFDQADRDDAGSGRYKVLIHKGNWVTDVVGCIAPGLNKTISGKGPMVTSSRDAMERIMDYVDGGEAQLTIRWIK